MVLSDQVSFVYILAESGFRGHLIAGYIERNSTGALDVFNAWGEWFEDLSGKRLRGWCLVGPDGTPVDGWREILPQDLPKISPSIDQ